ncbi:SCO7613 C-terminal domain-containing membrane protein [Herbidospora daliensis]|uniref:SCO7613 C-terminal domain-containing membrane protein n=1 Tax=Herbidospora daliensis TaxID=295585 RepID=UPI000AA56CCE|nr:hypothetical protein [Herbidospora daliensis]
MHSAGSPACPDCGAPLDGSPRRCPACELPLHGPIAAELWQLDLALNDLRGREARLLGRRAELLTALRAAGEHQPTGAWAEGAQAPVIGPTDAQEGFARGSSDQEAAGRQMGVQGHPGSEAAAPGQLAASQDQEGQQLGAAQGRAGQQPEAVQGQAGWQAGAHGQGWQSGGPGFQGPVSAKREMSPSAVRNLLLGLGGLLLVVAAFVFTIVSWGSVGIGGRAAILVGFTAVTFASPFLLVRRNLKATAETVALLGLALFLLDGYAAFQVWFEPDVDALAYTAVLIALAAGVFALYGGYARLSLPVPVAIGLAQFPLIILVADETVAHAAGALILTAAFDVAVWARTRRKVALAGLLVTWVVGVYIAYFQSTVSLSGPAEGALYGAILAVAAAEAGFLAPRSKRFPLVPIVGGVVAGVFAVRAPIAAVVPLTWAVLVAPVAAGVFALVLRGRARTTALVVGALASIGVLAPVLVVVRGPLGWGHGVWSAGWSAGAGEYLSRSPWVPGVPDLLLLGLIAVALALAVKQKVVATLAGALAVGFVPPVFDLPYPVMIAVLLVLTAGIAAVRQPAFGRLALGVSVIAVGWGLVSEAATLVVLAALASIAAGVAIWGTKVRDSKVRTWAANVAVVYAGGFTAAAWLAADLQPRFLPFVLLAVAAVAAPWRRTEIGAGIAGLAGLALVQDLRMFSLAAAAAGVIAAGVALRKDRGKVGYLATALLLTASWARLVAEDVTLVEAYTAPFSAVLLVFGWWKARTGSSWRAYGAGLTFTLLPSLFVLYDQPEGWVRPLALGVVALAVLVVGALRRLQAPAVLGGFTLAAVTVHGIAPWVADLVLLVPRWVPMALGGLLLLLVGATYESRIRDVKRVGAAIRGLR